MTIVNMLHGSHLYGLNTPDSDLDYKEIYIPDLSEYLLQKVNKTIQTSTGSNTSKNTKDDIDKQAFSINYFIELAIKGDTCAIDLLHAPDNWERQTSDIWKDLKSKRHLFYSKNLKSYTGYLKTQAHKYGTKGSRLDTAKKVLDWTDKMLMKYNHKKESRGIRLSWVIEEFPKLVHTEKDIRYIKDKETGDISIYHESYILIFDKKFMAYSYIEDLRESIHKHYKYYGQRAELAKENKNIDWKSISHAFRAGFQLKEIYTTLDLKYPLKDREFLLDVKQGKLNWVEDKIPDKLDKLINEIEELSKESSFPDKPPSYHWDSWLFNTLKNNFSSKSAHHN